MNNSVRKVNVFVHFCYNKPHNGPVYKTNWSGSNPYRTTVRTKFGKVRTKAGPAHVQELWSDKIWSGTKSGYVNAPCSSDQTKSLTFGGKSQSSDKNGESENLVQIGQTMKPGLL